MTSDLASSASIRLDDAFWNAFRSIVVREGIPYQWNALNDLVPDAVPSHCLRNFRIAAGLESGSHAGWVFQDSDLYKWIEGSAFSLTWHPDPALEDRIDSAAGWLSGYLLHNRRSG